MPYLDITTNTKPSEQESVTAEANEIMSDVLGKSLDYCVSRVTTGATMNFGASNEPCAFLHLRAIGFGEDKAPELSRRLCEMLEQRIGIPPERCCIQFEDVPRSMWGWNAKTFG